MEDNLFFLTVLAGTAMLTTTVLAAYSIYFMYKHEKAVYRDGYFKGLIEGKLLDKLSANEERETETQD